MKPTALLYQSLARITLFTRPNCSPCVDAKAVLDRVKKDRSFQYTELDVMQEQNERWKIYEFDTPVVRHSRLASSSKVC